jgi:hypothetical protein
MWGNSNYKLIYKEKIQIMKMEPTSVYEVSVTVVADITPTGKPKYII